MAGGINETINMWMRSRRINIPAHIVLTLLSLVYGLGVLARNFFYRISLFKSEKLPCRVISIGNLTTGGTGKTPVAIAVAGFLRKKGIKAVVVSRGYKRTTSGILSVSDGKSVFLTPEEAGDEPYLMAKRLKGVPVVVGGDRVAAGLYAIRAFKPEIIILDDAFQHLRIKRDLDIALVDGKDGFGNGFLLPRGILREPLQGIKRADAVFVKGGIRDDYLAKRFKTIKAPCFVFNLVPTGLVNISGDKDIGLECLKGKKVLAFAGLANPDSFLAAIENLGGKLNCALRFPDHHWFTQKDMDEIKKQGSDVELIVTTEKDAVRIRQGHGMDIYALRVDAVAEDKDAFKKTLEQVI